MTNELEVALAEIKFGFEKDDKTASDLQDYAEELLKEHDSLILAIAKATVIDRLVSDAQTGATVKFDADFATKVQMEIGREVGRILKPELERRATAASVVTAFRP